MLVKVIHSCNYHVAQSYQKLRWLHILDWSLIIYCQSCYTSVGMTNNWTIMLYTLLSNKTVDKSKLCLFVCLFFGGRRGMMGVTSSCSRSCFSFFFFLYVLYFHIAWNLHDYKRCIYTGSFETFPDMICIRA